MIYTTIITLFLSASLFAVVSSSFLEKECMNGGVFFDGACVCPSFVSGSNCENRDECTRMVENQYKVINPWNPIDIFYDPTKDYSGCDVHPEIICCWQNKSNQMNTKDVKMTTNTHKLAKLLSNYGPWTEMDKKMLSSLDRYWGGDVNVIEDYSDYIHVQPASPTPEGEKVKLAFIIMVHANYQEHIPLLFEAIYKPYHDYIIHVDSSTSYSDYDWLFRWSQTFLLNKTIASFEATGVRETHFDNIKFTQQRIKGAWGSIALVYQNIVALSELLSWSSASSNTWQHVVLLSAYDFPVKRISQLEEYLRNRRNTNFISVSSHTRLDRFQNTYENCYGEIKQMLFNTETCPTGKYPNRFYNDEKKENYKEGSQWTIITREFSEYLLKSFNGLESIMSMKFNLIPDESFYQTAISNSPFKEFHEWNALRFLPWKDGTTHPVVTLDVLDQISPTDFFARKIADHQVAQALYDRFIRQDKGRVVADISFGEAGKNVAKGVPLYKHNKNNEPSEL